MPVGKAVACAAVGCVVFGLMVAELLAAQPTERSPQDWAALDEILGSKALAWTFSQTGSIEKLDGRTALGSGTQPLTLSGSELFPADVEYRLVVRLIPPTGVANAPVDFRIGRKGPTDPNLNSPGDGLVQAFRRKDSPVRTKLFPLSGLDPVAQYVVTDMDRPDNPVQRTGKELIESGLPVEMNQAPQAAVIVYRLARTTE